MTGADIVYTDAWVSMGQEAEVEARRATLAPYQVNEALMATCAGCLVHALPARAPRRGSDRGVIDGPRSAVWRQAANRMHTARGAMLWLLNIPIEEEV